MECSVALSRIVTEQDLRNILGNKPIAKSLFAMCRQRLNTSYQKRVGESFVTVTAYKVSSILGHMDRDKMVRNSKISLWRQHKEFIKEKLNV